jgi:hypothetical protein
MAQIQDVGNSEVATETKPEAEVDDYEFQVGDIATNDDGEVGVVEYVHRREGCGTDLLLRTFTQDGAAYTNCIAAMADQCALSFSLDELLTLAGKGPSVNSPVAPTTPQRDGITIDALKCPTDAIVAMLRLTQRIEDVFSYVKGDFVHPAAIPEDVRDDALVKQVQQAIEAMHARCNEILRSAISQETINLHSPAKGAA